MQRIGFHANLASSKKNKPKISVVQITVPIAGVVKLFANIIIPNKYNFLKLKKKPATNRCKASRLLKQ